MKIFPKNEETKSRALTRASEPSVDLDEWESRYMLRTDQDDFGNRHDMWGQKGWFKPSCVPISIILVLIVLVVLLPLLDHADKQGRQQLQDTPEARRCRQGCRFSLVETIPNGMSYRNGTTPFRSTYDVWTDMIVNAEHTIEIASYYWTLRDGDVHAFPSSDKGEQIFSLLLKAGKERGLTVKIAQNQPSRSQPNIDTELLQQKGNAQVRSLNFARLVGSGILHTKLWLVDRRRAYVGSANTDWRSLTQVKESGIFVDNCPCVVADIAKIFDVYWLLGKPAATIPPSWPVELATHYNQVTPMNISANSSEATMYIASSPQKFCPAGRTSDIDAITDTISRAEKFIYVAVMDYYPLMIYTPKHIYWGVIDNALRSASVRGVEVRLLVSWWNHSRDSEKHFLRSLHDLTGAYPNVNISVRLFVVPSTAAQSKIPYSRVNHNKYMVTDNTAYIGTSNWSGDYFTVTGGVGVVVGGATLLRVQLEQLFLRDWNSEFAYTLPH